MSMTEKLELLGKDVYDHSKIPGEITLKSLPTASELDYVSAEDFENVMLTKILPQAIEEDIDFNQLLEIDYYWICRALRIMNYGPFHRVNNIYCNHCQQITEGEYNVDLRTVEVKPLPPKFVNSIIISKDEFIEYNKDIELKLRTIQEARNSEKDKQFELPNGRRNTMFANLIYSIATIGGRKVDPVSAVLEIQNNMSAADYAILRDLYMQNTEYGLMAYGTVSCPNCHMDARYVVFVNEKFFRPTLSCLREWKRSRIQEQAENSDGDEAATVREHNGRSDFHLEGK